MTLKGFAFIPLHCVYLIRASEALKLSFVPIKLLSAKDAVDASTDINQLSVLEDTQVQEITSDDPRTLSERIESAKEDSERKAFAVC